MLRGDSGRNPCDQTNDAVVAVCLGTANTTKVDVGLADRHGLSLRGSDGGLHWHR